MNRGAGWEPTTESEVALYDALVAGDQEKYFRALGRAELMLPVSADAVAGRSPMGWATWTSNDHTHLLAFTSIESMRTCLAEHAGAARRMSFPELATAWPNQDWWLAVNPGLPIEGYLPSWFVMQLGRGDARLPAQKSSPPRDRLARVEALERAKAARAAAQHPRELREPVRVSATVAPRALPSAPALPDPALAPSVWTEPTPPWTEPTPPWTEPTPIATPWLQPASSPLVPPRPEPPAPLYAAPLPQRPLPPPPPTLADPGAGRFDAAPLPPRSVPQEPTPPSRYEALVPASWPEPAASARPTTASPSTRPDAAPPAQPAPPSTWDEPTPASVPSASTWDEPTPASVRQTPNGHVPSERPRHAEPEPEFVPANAVEEQLFEAAEAGNTDAFLSTLLLATVLIPKSSGTTNGQWRPQPIDGEPHLICYTSTQHLEDALETVSIRFIKLISAWPDPTWSFAVNPGSPVGATLPGGQLLALASWAAEVGLGGDDDDQEQTKTESGTPAGGRASPELTVLQKAIAPSQVGYYLERGYDRVSGFVHRAREVGHLRGAEQMRRGLGLHWEGSPFAAGATELFVLRWLAYRPNLYRIPYGGQHEAGMRAMEGWVIERAPFRGNGFAPGDSTEIIAEFKVDSARLPHGARLLRLRADGSEEIIAVLDSDGQRWLRTDGGS